MIAALVLSIRTPTATSQASDPSPDPGSALTITAPPVPPSPPPKEQSKRAAWLSDEIDRAIAAHPRLAGAAIGVAVRDLAGKKSLYAHDADKRFNVASNAKLITTAAVLHYLGPDFRFYTSIFVDDIDEAGVVAGNLYVRGRADPSLGTEDLRALAADIALYGVTAIRGQIVIDDSYFDKHTLPPHFSEQPDEDAAFRAPIGAASLNFNSVSFVITPSRTGTGPARVLVDPPADYVHLQAAVETVTQGRTRLRVESEAKRQSLEVKLVGQIRADQYPYRIRHRVPHPALYLGSALRAQLAAHDIAVRGRKIGRDVVPDDALLIASRRSPPLAVLIRGMGKYSNNFVAEMLLKTIGAEVKSGGEPASFDDGLAAVREYLTEKLGFAPEGFRYDNGSGLFDATRLSPNQLVTVLATAYADFRYGPDLMASLAIAGADGTLRSRMEDGPAQRMVRAKTGTLETVSALSGYAAADDQAPLAFSILVNDIPAGAMGDARSLEDDIAQLLVTFLSRSPSE